MGCPIVQLWTTNWLVVTDFSPEIFNFWGNSKSKTQFWCLKITHFTKNA